MPSGRYKRKPVSIKTRKKMSETHKRIGTKPPSRKGCKFSEEHCQKISEAKIGYFMPTETRKKISDANKKENHPNWQGGLTSLNHSIRKLFLYRQWRSDVFTRDDYTCQFCGIKGVKLNADHIKPLSIIIREYNITTTDKAINCSELWDINNGRTLCISCHESTDTFGYKSNYLTSNY